MAELLGQALSVSLGARLAVDGVSFRASPSEVTCILGPNGAGKSTLLRAVMSLVPYRGRVLLDGADVRDLGAGDRARKIAYVPQRSLLEAPLSVEAVVLQGRFAHSSALSAPSAHDREVARLSMARTDVLSLARRRFDRLSTGERRRVLVARALATEARVILLDEPTAALDVRHVLELHALLRELASDGFTIVVVLHALEDARRYTDRAILLSNGALVAEGPSAEIVSRERVREVYGVALIEGGAPGFELGGEE
jgi:iron complex transport system ATP-binding protein